MDIRKIWDDLGTNDHLAYKGSSKSHADLIAEMEKNAGLEVSSINTSGSVERVRVKPTGNVRGDRGQEKSGWYFYFQHGNHFYCNYGNWRTNMQYKFSSQDTNFLSVQEQAKIKAELDKRYQEQQKRREENYQEVAKQVKERFKKTIEVKEHQYLKKKKVKNYGFRELGGNLSIPMYSTKTDDFDLCSMQTIYKDGSKRFVSGSRVKGSVFPLGFSLQEISNLEKIIIAEGVASASSIFESTDVPTLCVFSANFGLECLSNLRKYTQAKFILAFDNDKSKTGEKNAQNIKSAIFNCEIRIPNKLGYDYNDIHQEFGVAEVKNQLLMNKNFDLRKTSLKNFDTNPPERSWLVKGLIENGKTGLFCSIGGIGKSFLNLSLAFNISRGTGSFLGNPIEKYGNVLMMVAEDDYSEIHKRIHLLDPNNTRKDSLYDVFILSVPELDKPLTLIKDDGVNGLHITDDAYEIIEGLSAIPDLAMVCIDPLQAFIQANTNDNMVGQLYSQMAQMIASRYDTAVIGVHHLTKGGLESQADIMQWRASIRGASSFVDSSRWCISASLCDEESGRQICLEQGEEYDRMKVVRVAMVKSNSESDMSVKTMIRKNGILQILQPKDEIKWEN